MSIVQTIPPAALLFVAALNLSAQTHRMAYRHSFGPVFSAGVRLPAYRAVEIDEAFVPRAINDQGIVLLAGPDNEWFRWRGGVLEQLQGVPETVARARMNESGLVLMSGYDATGLCEVTAWHPGSSAAIPVQRQFLPHEDWQMLHELHLNDHGEFTVSAECDNGFTSIPYAYYSVTAFGSLDGQWLPLAETTGYYNADGSHGSTGTTYFINDLNNYASTIGEFGEYAESTPPEGWPTTIHVDDFHYTMDETILDFEPVALTDSMTLIGRELDDAQTLFVSDNFGERYLQGDTGTRLSGTPLVSNPDGPFEEIVMESRYWKRMEERDFAGSLTGSPAPDFYEGDLSELLSNKDEWTGLYVYCISRNGRMAGRGRYTDPQTGASRQTAFVLVAPVLVPDWNRDGSIDRTDQLLSDSGRPWRFWVNDDDDDGDLARSSGDDLPASAVPGGRVPDAADLMVDGTRDCVDFFPVHLNIRNHLRAAGDLTAVSIRLSQEEGALNLLFSNLLPGQAGRIHDSNPPSGFGGDYDAGPGQAGLVNIPENGIDLPLEILRAIRDHDHSVVFLEAAAETEKPLELTMTHHGQTVLNASLPLSISRVEDMFRVINLRNADPKFSNADPGPWPTDTGDPPNLPDAVLSTLSGALRTIVHIHGFNWSGWEIPAAHAEIFKRLYQAGSMARFVGITWFGDQGTVDWAGSSFDYNENVVNALVSAKYVAEALAGFLGPRTALFSHSLGTMVAASTVVDHGIEVGHCLLLNAAVPNEAFIGEQADRRLMVHPDWKDELDTPPDYPEHLLAANWAELFPPDDRRSALSWKDRFRDLSNLTECTHFYSSAEDVLKPGDGAIPNLISEVITGNEQVWVFNEMVKGTTTLSASLTGDIHGGWGMNRHYMVWHDPGGPAHPPPGDWNPMTPSNATTIPLTGLVPEPFFRPFSDGDADYPAWGNGSWLYADAATANPRLPPADFTLAGIDQIKNHAKILAEAIPAHSAPAGATPLPDLPLLRNYDMDTSFRSASDWPYRDEAEDRGRWLHSDYLNPALTYVHKVYALCSKTVNQL